MDAYRISHIYYVDPFIQAVTNGVASIRHASPAHCHDFYEFFLVTRGSCIHQVNGHAQHLPEGALVFMRPDDHHAYLGDNGLSARLCAGPLPPVVSLSQGEVHRFIEQTRTMKMLAAIDKPRCRLLFRTQLAEVLLRFTQTGTRTAGDPLPLWLESLLLQMQKKEHFTAGLGRLCMLSGRSPGHVNRVFKKVLGETPTEYLNRLKLDHARHLLTTTGMKVVEIALECGFDNLSHFHHTFRRIYGVPPARMRALNRSA